MGQASSLQRYASSLSHFSPSPGPGQGSISPGPTQEVEDVTSTSYQPTIKEIRPAKPLPLQKLLPKE